MKRSMVFLLVISIVMISFGCAVQSKYMRPVSLELESSYAPDSKKAVVVFMRPSRFGGAIQSSVFDVTTDENLLVGIVSSQTKVAYKVSPGEHLFMVIGESADFMKAHLEAGKTYYALVTPRMGAWKARFSLKPVRKDELGSSEFENWNKACKYVENTDSAHQWAEDNAPSIQSKRERYYQKWINKPEEKQPVLNREDGV